MLNQQCLFVIKAINDDENPNDSYHGLSMMNLDSLEHYFNINIIQNNV
jgi:hypothetical protein